MFKTTKQIKDWLDEYGVENYTINDNCTVDVEGYVDVYRQQLIEIPVQFNHVSGNFDCSYNQLTTLEFCPKAVEGNFYCGNNQLISLDFFPQSIGGSFLCDNNLQLGDLQNIEDFNVLKATLIKSSMQDFLPEKPLVKNKNKR